MSPGISSNTFVFVTREIEIYPESIILFRGTLRDSTAPDIYRTRFRTLTTFLRRYFPQSYTGYASALLITSGYQYLVEITDNEADIVERKRHEISDYNIILGEIRRSMLQKPVQDRIHLQALSEKFNFHLASREYEAYRDQLDGINQTSLEILHSFSKEFSSIVLEEAQVYNSATSLLSDQLDLSNLAPIDRCLVLIPLYSLQVLQPIEFLRQMDVICRTITRREIAFLQFFSLKYNSDFLEFSIGGIIRQFHYINILKKIAIHPRAYIVTDMNSIFYEKFLPIKSLQKSLAYESLSHTILQNTPFTALSLALNIQAALVSSDIYSQNLVHSPDLANSIGFGDLRRFQSIIYNTLTKYFRMRHRSDIISPDGTSSLISKIISSYISTVNMVARRTELCRTNIQYQIMEIQIMNKKQLQLRFNYQPKMSLDGLLDFFRGQKLLPQHQVRRAILFFQISKTTIEIFAHQADRYSILKGVNQLVTEGSLLDYFRTELESITQLPAYNGTGKFAAWMSANITPIIEILTAFGELSKSDPRKILQHLLDLLKDLLYYKEVWYRHHVLELVSNILISCVIHFEELNHSDLRKLLDLLETQFIDPDVEVQYLNRELLVIRLLRLLLDQRPLDPAFQYFLKIYFEIDPSQLPGEEDSHRYDEIRDLVDQIATNTNEATMPVGMQDGTFVLLDQVQNEDLPYSTNLPVLPPELYDVIGFDRFDDYLYLHQLFYLLQDRVDAGMDPEKIYYDLINAHPEMEELKDSWKEITQLRELYPHLVDRTKLELMRVKLIIRIEPVHALGRLEQLLGQLEEYGSRTEDYLEVLELLVEVGGIMGEEQIVAKYSRMREKILTGGTEALDKTTKDALDGLDDDVSNMFGME